MTDVWVIISRKLEWRIQVYSTDAVLDQNFHPVLEVFVQLCNLKDTQPANIQNPTTTKLAWKNQSIHNRYLVMHSLLGIFTRMVQFSASKAVFDHKTVVIIMIRKKYISDLR